MRKGKLIWGDKKGPSLSFSTGEKPSAEEGTGVVGSVVEETKRRKIPEREKNAKN